MTGPKQQETEIQSQALESEVQSQIPEETATPNPSPDTNPNPDPQVGAQGPDLTEPVDTPPVVQEPQPGPVEETVQTTVTYVIQKGDTLLDICRKKYGTVGRVKEICELNGIENADDIKMGQIILLPE